MSISLSYPDKVIAGLNQSYTITTDEGPPRVSVRLNAQVLPHRLILLGPPKSEADSRTPVKKYKLSFYLPEGSAGGVLSLEVEAGASRIEESKPVVES